MFAGNERQGTLGQSKVYMGNPFGPGSIINQLYQICLDFQKASRLGNKDEKMRLWKAFQLAYMRALRNAKNINEELPVPDRQWYPDEYLDDATEDQVIDPQMDTVVQIVVDAIEYRLKKKGLAQS